MSQLYTSYSSISKNNNSEIKENIYASWAKEKNTWGKSNSSSIYIPMPTSPPPPLKPHLPPPPLPDKRQLSVPPKINRTNKPEIYKFKEGYIEKYY